MLDWTADNITDKKEIQVQVDLVLACQLQKQSYRRIKVKLPQKIKTEKDRRSRFFYKKKNM